MDESQKSIIDNIFFGKKDSEYVTELRNSVLQMIEFAQQYEDINVNKIIDDAKKQADDIYTTEVGLANFLYEIQVSIANELFDKKMKAEKIYKADVEISDFLHDVQSSIANDIVKK